MDEILIITTDSDEITERKRRLTLSNYKNDVKDVSRFTFIHLNNSSRQLATTKSTTGNNSR